MLKLQSNSVKSSESFSLFYFRGLTLRTPQQLVRLSHFKRRCILYNDSFSTVFRHKKRQNSFWCSRAVGEMRLSTQHAGAELSSFVSFCAWIFKLMRCFCSFNCKKTRRRIQLDVRTSETRFSVCAPCAFLFI